MRMSRPSAALLRNCCETTNSNLPGWVWKPVIRLYICLGGEVSAPAACSQQPAVTGPLSTPILNGVNAGIAAFAGTGSWLMIRFIYNFGPIGAGAMDAPIDVISMHIDQLAPILIQNKDLIFALEAGFIGTWGEWHDRSEEHTSELQSLRHLVCRLLLEKKKN